jgi:serine/threonine-protein kinase HipA
MSDVSLQDLAEVVEADVYKAGRLAAVLHRGPTSTDFRYVADYLDDRSTPPIASTLPKSSLVVRTPAGSVPAFFAGLLPEGRRLTALRDAIKTSADDEFSLLLAVGADTVGNVQIVRHSFEPAGAENVLKLDEWSDISFAELVGDWVHVDRSALAGVQDKISAQTMAIRGVRNGLPAILKVNGDNHPFVVQNEAFFLDWSARAGISTAKAHLIHDRDGEPGLLVERFDREAKRGRIVARHAVEDACQVLGRWPADKYKVTAEEAVVGLAALCSAPLVALQELFRMVVFAVLIGNGDQHAKNLSVLNATAEWRVAPAYDVVSTVVYGDRTTALSIAGKKRDISRKTMLQFAENVGLPNRAAVRALDEVLSLTTDLVAEVQGGALPFNEQVTKDLVAELAHRRRLLSAT